ncbi:MAG: primosomal replication protein N [Betaproteobacteria bacterium]
MSGALIELGSLRYTPAGLAAVEFRIRHASEVAEAGGTRTVQAEVAGIAFESLARVIAATQLGAHARFEGFLGAKSKRSKKLVLHVTNIELSEGGAHASTQAEG